MTATKTTRSPARDRILAAASKLFYQEGIRSVGIDRIIAESGVAKMSLYKHFKSKDELIATWLRQQDERWRTWLKATVDGLATEPRDRILAVFDAQKEWFEQPNFRGCAFINSTVEITDPEHPAYAVCVEHHQAMYDYLLSLVQAAGLSDSEAIAQQLVILVEGAVVVAMTQGSSDAATFAKQAANALLLTAKSKDAVAPALE